MKKIVILAYFLSNLVFQVSAQLLTSEEAVSIALKNNFDILIARNDADIDKINNTAGNAGMLPSVAITGTDNYAINDSHSEFLSSSSFSKSNAHSNVLNAGGFLNWTLFDGGKMFVTKKRLSEIEALGELQFKDRVMTTTLNVILAYFDVVRQKQQLFSINEVIKYNLENVKILEVSFNAGLTPKTNLLQAKIDLNVYLENAINQKMVITASKRNLNGILGRDVDTGFEVLDSIPLGYTPDSNDLAKKLYSSNLSILAAQKQVDVAQLIFQENRTLLLPKVSISAGYNFLQSNNPSGPSLTLNRAYGPQLGGSISIPLFQGGNALRQIKSSKLQLQSAQYAFEGVKLQVNLQLQNALTDFQNQQQLFQIEKDNALLAKENLEISLQRLRYGQTTSLEVHQAQDNYVQSLTRLVNFEYNLKSAETRLKQLLAGL